ncbi:MAG: class I SAM-dependent methyltransferase [Myxococcota bacterium]
MHWGWGLSRSDARRRVAAPPCRSGRAPGLAPARRDSSDAAELLAAARQRAARVVVKRPHRAPPLAPGTSHALASKLVRFDVYVNASRVRRAGDAAGTSREDVSSPLGVRGGVARDGRPRARPRSPGTSLRVDCAPAM